MIVNVNYLTPRPIQSLDLPRLNSRRNDDYGETCGSSRGAKVSSRTSRPKFFFICLHVPIVLLPLYLIVQVGSTEFDGPD